MKNSDILLPGEGRWWLGQVILIFKKYTSKSQEETWSKIPIPNYKTSIGNNYGSIKHKAMTFACSMGFFAIADRMT